ncbi:MAG: hypothetical protein EAZ55_11895 [Cytophagales bacterium]|nr:MAG: hypothetical protein EAZ55_11895 [Cytophagales bacterium]
MTTRLRLFQKTAFFINIILSIYIMLEVVLQLSFLVAQTPLQYFISQKATQWLIVKPQIGYVSATFLGQTKGFVVQCSELSIPSLEANEPFIEQMNLHLLFSWQGTLLQTNCSDGHIYLLQNAQNKKLYEVFRFTKNNKDTAQKNEKRTLPEMLTFENVRFTQINKAKKNTIRLHLQRINLRLLTQLPTIAAEAIGTLKVIQFSFNRFAPKNDFLREQQVQLYLNIQYVPQVNYILITTQQLEINKVDCEANMRINMDTTRAYELEARTHNISLFQGLKMLPDRIQRLFKGYEAEGFFDVYLNIEGNLKPDNSPRIRANFTCQKNTLVYVPLKDTLKNLQIEGFFANYQLSQPKNIGLKKQQPITKQKNCKYNFL